MIIPSLDLIEGQIVRLFKGDYNQVTNYMINLEDQCHLYHESGCDWLHLVDLTGAKDTTNRQLNLITTLLATLPANVQIGGGVRTAQDVRDLLTAGAQRVVVGSTAIETPKAVKTWIEKHGVEKIVLALDVNIDLLGVRKVAVSGWQKDSGVTIESLIDDYLKVGLKHVLCTDISRDGTLKGSNVELYIDLCRRYPQIQFQASGGIGSLDDLANLKGSGVSGVIIGRALLDGKFTLKEAVECWRKE